MTTSDWRMSSEDQPAISDAATWRAQIKTSGAIRQAPRELTCWFAGRDLAIRDNEGRLLWLSAGPTTVCRDETRGLIESDEDDPVEGLINHPAPEAAALQETQSALAWLGVREPYLATRSNSTRLGRAARSVVLATDEFDPIEIITDRETDRVLSISANHHQHGPLSVTVTSFTPDTRPFEVTPADRS